MPAHVLLCPVCAKLFEVAYKVKELPRKPGGTGSRATCENCGKRVVILTEYELTLKGREA